MLTDQWSIKWTNWVFHYVNLISHQFSAACRLCGGKLKRIDERNNLAINISYSH